MTAGLRRLSTDPIVLRDRQDEAIGVIRRLFNGERVTAKSDWFTLQDAALQLLPLQEEMPMAVASQISPSGFTLAGKYGIGVISVGSVGQPRDCDNRACFVIYDSRRREVTYHRVPYDIETSAQKIFDADLALNFGKRLFLGV